MACHRDAVENESRHSSQHEVPYNKLRLALSGTYLVDNNM